MRGSLGLSSAHCLHSARQEMLHTDVCTAQRLSHLIISMHDPAKLTLALPPSVHWGGSRPHDLRLSALVDGVLPTNLNFT